MTESAAARLRLRSALSLRAACASRRARPAVNQASTTSEDDHAADDGDHRKLLQGQPKQHLAAGSDAPHEQQHAGNARGHETGEVASHANSGVFSAACIGIHGRKMGTRGQRHNELKAKAREANHTRLCGG